MQKKICEGICSLFWKKTPVKHSFCLLLLVHAKDGIQLRNLPIQSSAQDARDVICYRYVFYNALLKGYSDKVLTVGLIGK